MVVDPGSLDKRIQIVKIKRETDSKGFWQETEESIRKCYAKVSNSTGTELTKANADFSEVKVRFLVRYTKTKIDTSMSVKFANDIYDIKYINDYDYSHEYVEILGVKRCHVSI